jgi:hypothetical protein
VTLSNEGQFLNEQEQVQNFLMLFWSVQGRL